MSEQLVGEQLEEIRKVAETLLRQGEHCALAGLLPQAIALFRQSWELAHDNACDLANIAAWETAWLLVRQHAYNDATRWFERVAEPVPQSPLWPATRQALIEHYHLSAQSTLHSIAPQPSSVHLPTLQITTLGRFVIERDGRPLPTCRARKALAVFRYLLTRRYYTARKEELIEVFWADTPPREATHSLHVAIGTLRRYLDTAKSSFIILDAGAYCINPAASVEDDCARFVHLCDTGEHAFQANDLARAQQAFSEALACYGGDYVIDDGDLTWALVEQERLLMRYLQALDCLGRIFIAQHLFESAITCYQQLLERDSYREDAHAQIMRCYLQLGRRTDALRQYERCVLILRQELGIEPMPTLEALYHSIVSNSVGKD